MKAETSDHLHDAETTVKKKKITIVASILARVINSNYQRGNLVAATQEGQ